MRAVTHALCWAIMLLAAAAAARFGVMDKGSATTLLIVLPIAAWTALTGRGCVLRRRA
ncbi:MAG TPA: hypothetical protein VN518_06835 [Methyloceanibacter sp.]|jgi:hypothetical protein|nr:hypothetical protein [Methyloceanibacter sp.]